MTPTLAIMVADCVAEQIAIADKALGSALMLLKIPEVKAIVVRRCAEGHSSTAVASMLADIESLGDFEHLLKGAVGRGDLI